MLSDNKYSLVKLSLVLVCLAVFLNNSVQSKSVASEDELNSSSNNAAANLDGVEPEGGLDEVAARLARIRLYRSLIRNEETALSQMISSGDDEEEQMNDRRKKSNHPNMKNYLKRGMKTMALGFGK